MATVSTSSPLAMPEPTAHSLDGKLLWTLLLATVLAVGNIYYSQPLLGEIAVDFQRSAASVGLIPMLTQMGYVAGLLLVTPLGDTLEKKNLIIWLLGLAGLALLSAALSPCFGFFTVSAVAIGVTAVVTQILIPFVASLSAPEQRSRNLGKVLSAALLGVLLSRTLSGYIGAHLGWRGSYFVASALMLNLAVTLHFLLPRQKTGAPLRYLRLLQSIWHLFRNLPELRDVAITGGLMYASLTAFWASLAFYLQSDVYHRGPDLAGSFGLVGAIGALGTNLVGRHVDRLGPRRVVQLCIATMFAAYFILVGAGSHMWGLILGVLVLDLGAQAATVSNQTQIYQFHSHAQTRLNTVYKVFYFVGGAIGASASTAAWQYFGWNGVCGVGLAFLVLSFAWEKLR